MAFFGKKSAQSPRSQRSVPQLDPIYYADIHTSIRGWGGTDDFQTTVTGINTAIFNTGNRILETFDERQRLAEFQRFERVLNNVSAGDQMIDFLIQSAPESDELLTTLLQRLRDTYSRPPT